MYEIHKEGPQIESEQMDLFEIVQDDYGEDDQQK